MLNDVTYLSLDCFASLLLRSHPEKMAIPFTLANTAQIEPKEPEGFSLQRIHHPGFLPIQFHAERRELFLEPLQGAFRPAAFGVVAADSDDDIVSEPVIVHCLIKPLRRFAANRVKGPVHFIQIDVRRQWAERTPLRDSDLSSSIDDLLYEVQNLRVLDPLRDLV